MKIENMFSIEYKKRCKIKIAPSIPAKVYTVFHLFHRDFTDSQGGIVIGRMKIDWHFFAAA
jgi:hypothetical protein